MFQLFSILYHCVILVAHVNSELSTNSAEQQSTSADSSEGIEVDKKLAEYKVGEEVNCFVKSVRLTGLFAFFSVWSIECRFCLQYHRQSSCGFTTGTKLLLGFTVINNPALEQQP